MAGMGPPPKPAEQRRRRNLAPQNLQLPSEGRKGATPKWPLPSPSNAEKALWRDLWRMPQAVMWERIACHREVAQYARWKVLAEAGEIDAAKEARQLSDRLGLSPLALLRLRWEIASDEVAEARESKTVVAKADPRRLTAVDPGAVAGA